jgi:lipoprotein-anchoring transpeptidase ErfK/SrfK
MKRVTEYAASGTAGRVWRIAVLTAAGAIGGVSQADAALYYWSDSGYYSRPEPMVAPRRQKPRHQQSKKIQAPEKESSKPQGPLIIAISIEKQRLRIYDANGFFAETPISTGMQGHSTPMGVFSVIQKHKFHHSNIYSGAPMPYMQRITWSGVAMHAGVLPGYPASHGCIRMPMAFAVKMWNWTKMGARVVVTPGEMTPSSFSHPLLVAQKIVPQPVAEPQADAPPAAKSDKASDAGAVVTPTISEVKLELRSTVGHIDGPRPMMGEPSAPTSLREQTHTANAGSNMPAANLRATMNDAATTGNGASAHEDAVAPTDSAPPAAENNASAKATEATPEVKSEAATSEAEQTTAKPAETVSTDDKATETKPSEAVAAEANSRGANSPGAKPGETAASDDAGNKPDQIQPAAQAGGDTDTAVTAATGNLKTEAKASEKPDDIAKDTAKDTAKENAKAVTDVGAGVGDARKDDGKKDDGKKDQARLPDIAKSAAAKLDPVTAAPKRTGQIAVFVSRKDQKLYVRQNFSPLFAVPVTIAASERPLGTHVFTARIDKDDANVVHWSVVSLPVPRHMARRDDDERVSRKRKMAGAVEMKELPTPDSPTEALDRLTIPTDVMARITEALSTGGSIIVSDQGINQGETGEGTDFIVSLR